MKFCVGLAKNNSEFLQCIADNADSIYEVYFSFKWFFFDENIHSENYIAASTDREQAAFRIPV